MPLCTRVYVVTYMNIHTSTCEHVLIHSCNRTCSPNDMWMCRSFLNRRTHEHTWAWKQETNFLVPAHVCYDSKRLGSCCFWIPVKTQKYIHGNFFHPWYIQDIVSSMTNCFIHCKHLWQSVEPNISPPCNDELPHLDTYCSCNDELPHLATYCSM